MHRVAGRDVPLRLQAAEAGRAVGDSPAAEAAISQQYADPMAAWLTLRIG